MPNPFTAARPLITAAILVSAAATITSAGEQPSPPEFSLGFGCAMTAIKFGPTEPLPYTMFLSPGVSGYTEFDHPGNFARVRSASGLFEATEDANHQYEHVASARFATVAELRAALTDPNGWTLEVTDGFLKQTYTFTFHIDASAFPDEYLRPITFTNVAPGDTIPRNPTFSWNQATTSNPGAQEDSAFSQMYNDDFSRLYVTPGISPTDTSWTPTGPIAPDRYTVFIGTLNNHVDQNLITASVDRGASPGAVLYSVIPFTSARSFSICPNLTVPCAADLNADGAVNTADLTRFLGQFGKTCAQVTAPCADFNNDGSINTADLTYFLGRFGAPCQ